MILSPLVFPGLANRRGLYPYFFEKVAVHAGHEILMDVDDNNLLIIGNPHVILRPTAQASLNPLIKYCYYYIN